MKATLRDGVTTGAGSRTGPVGPCPSRVATRDPRRADRAAHSPDAAHAHAAPDAARAPAGFSLIEILVVLVIIAAVAAAVTLGMAGAGGERQVERDAERLRALIGFACEQAELRGRSIGISLSRGGYEFSSSEHADWLPLQDGALRPRKWSAPATATLTRGGHGVEVGADFPEKPQLVCFASGELTPFRLELAPPDTARRFRLDGQPDGDVVASSVDGRAP